MLLRHRCNVVSAGGCSVLQRTALPTPTVCSPDSHESPLRGFAASSGDNGLVGCLGMCLLGWSGAGGGLRPAARHTGTVARAEVRGCLWGLR